MAYFRCATLHPNVVFFNYTTMQMTSKIVYYGPGLCGKTTNLQHIHQKTASKSRGEMISLETETDRTLFFDLLPLDVGVIGGMKVRLQLYTVPGQVFYNATRKLVLKSVDGIVFVVDSQISMLDSNIESLKNLVTNLAELNLTMDQVPIVFQFNKRDIRNIHTVEKLNEVLNPRGYPFFEAAALHGIGVFETLKCISRLGLASVKKKVLTDDRKKPATVAAPVAAAPAALAAPPSPAPPGEPADPVARLVPDTGIAEEVPVEFAEEDTDKHVRAVATKAQVDIQQELENLRTLASSPSRTAAPAPKGSSDVERRLATMLITDRESRQEVRRKAIVEIPSRLLKGDSTLKLHLAFGDGGAEELVRDTVTVKLVGNRRLERLTLRIDLELKSKE